MKHCQLGIFTQQLLEMWQSEFINIYTFCIRHEDNYLRRYFWLVFEGNENQPSQKSDYIVYEHAHNFQYNI
jgi:hypothetical protein